MNVNFFCTKCGAPMNSDDSRPSVFCTRCGSREAVPRNVNTAPTQPQYYPPQPQAPQPQYAPVQAPQPQSAAPGQPNLIVNYNSIRVDVQCILEVPATGMRYFMQSGMSVPLTLYPGQHRLVLQIGRKRYARSVFLPSGNQHVTIYASWNGRAHITIDQPFVAAGYVQPAPAPQPVQTYAPQPQYQPQPQYIAPPAPVAPPQLQAQSPDWQAAAAQPEVTAAQDAVPMPPKPEFNPPAPQDFGTSTDTSFAPPAPQDFGASTDTSFAPPAPQDFGASTNTDFAPPAPQDFGASTNTDFAPPAPQDFEANKEADFAPPMPESPSHIDF